MKRTAIFALFLMLCTTYGCAHTELTRRYKSKNYDTAPAGKEYVKLSAFVMTPPQPPQSTLLSQITTPEGQAALISKMSEWATSPEELYKALAVSEKGHGDSESTIDKTVFKKRVVFSVEKEPPGKGEDDLTPADRISALTVTLKIPKEEKDGIKEQKEAQEGDRKELEGKNEKEGTSQQKAKTHRAINDPIFEDCNKFDNKYETVNLGTLHRTQHATAGGTLEVGPAIDVKVPVSGKANISRETTIDENINLQQRFILMSGAIKDNKKKAVIFQESQVGFDLTGNFSVDFTIRIKNHKRSGFILLSAVENDGKPTKTEEAKKGGKPPKTEKVKKDGKPSKPEEFKIDFGSLIYPVNSIPVQCDLTSDYIIRHLRQLPLYDRYDRELAEGLHRVVFVSGSSKKGDVELISSRELKTVIYKIVLEHQEHLPLFLGRPVYDENRESKPIDRNPLRFTKLDDAKKFLAWLRESKSAKIGKYKIYQHDESEVTKEDIGKLRIRAEQLNY